MELKIIKIHEPIENFMKSRQFKKEIDEPTIRYQIFTLHILHMVL